jgi:hypothetical protein
MPKFGDIYINQISFYELEEGTIFNILFAKIGDTVKACIGMADSITHSGIMEQLLQSEKMFSVPRQTGKTGKDIPRADFFDAGSKKHGKILACGNMKLDPATKHITYYGNSLEYGIGMKLLEVRNLMSNYYPDSGFSYDVE